MDFSHKMRIRDAKKYSFHRSKENNTCVIPSCSAVAINSHLFQKQRVLREIAERGRVYVSTVDSFEREVRVKFVSKSIGKSVTVPLLCSEHDESIFKDIESGEIDFENQRHHILLAYRPMLNTVWEDRMVVKVGNESIESYCNKPVNLAKEADKIFIGTLEQSLLLKEHSLSLLEKDVFDGSCDNFTFFYRKLPPLGVSATGIYGDINGPAYGAERWLGEGNCLVFGGVGLGCPASVFVNLITLENETVLSIGFLKIDEDIISDYIKNIRKCQDNELLEIISDLILKGFLTVYYGPEFYRNNIERNEERIIDTMQRTLSCHHEDDPIGALKKIPSFNLFDPKN